MWMLLHKSLNEVQTNKKGKIKRVNTCFEYKVERFWIDSTSIQSNIWSICQHMLIEDIKIWSIFQIYNI